MSYRVAIVLPLLMSAAISSAQTAPRPVARVELLVAAQIVTDSNGQPALLDQDSNIRVTLTTDLDGSQALRFAGVNSCEPGGGRTSPPKLLPDMAKPFVPAAKNAATWRCGQRGVLTVKADSVQFASEGGTTRLDKASISTSLDNGVFVISAASSRGNAASPVGLITSVTGVIGLGGKDARDPNAIALQTGMAAQWVTGLIAQSLHDFAGAVAHFRELARMSTPTGGDLTLVVTPGGAQTYLDDEFKGVTSSDGRLVVKDVKPGAHSVRVDLPGYKELSQPITIIAGQNNDLSAQLQRKGPDPISEAEIEDGLKQGVTPVRMTALVREIGVAFTMDDDIEKRLRALGADDSLILAIMKSKR